MNEIDGKTYDGRLHHPSRLLLIGKSGAGKTNFTINLLKESNQLFDEKFKNIYWFYGTDSPFRGEDPLNMVQNIHYIKGMPNDLTEYIDETIPNLLIFDDLFSEIMDSEQMVLLFTKWSTHSNTSVILLSQDIFQNGKCAGNSRRTTITRNSNYMVIFRNPLDNTTISTIGSRIMPKQSKLFQKIFEAACNYKSYLFIDGHQSSPAELRFRTDIFGGSQRIFQTEIK